METDRDKLGNTLKELFIQIIDSHLKPVFSREGIMAALTEIMDLANNIVEGAHGADTGERVACQAGCSYCCHSQIKLTPVEVLLVFSWVNTNFSDSDRNLLGKRIRKNRLLTKGRTFQERVLIKDSTPCIFLEDGVCIIYPVRPFICRAWTSYSSKACREAFQSKNHNAEIETSTSSNYVFSLARETIQDVCRCNGMESEPLELPKAMAICLSSNDSFGRWLQGKAMFCCDTVCETRETDALLFMEIHVSLFLKRFSLSYKKDCSCIEYFLYSRKKKKHISTELIVSYDTCSNSLYVSKFYPEIYKESFPKYMSAACFFLMLHHAASTCGINCDTFVSLETKTEVFETFYSRLKDFDFTIRYRRTSDNYNIRGIYHVLPVDTSMITVACNLPESEL